MNIELKEQIQDHNRRNKELKKILQSKGLNEESQINAEYHFWADKHSDAVALANRFYDEGFLILVLAPVDDEVGTSWNIEVQKQEPLNVVVSEQNTRYLIETADKFDSIYDGWGTQVQ